MPVNVQIQNFTNTFNAQIIITSSANAVVVAAQTGTMEVTDLMVSVNTQMTVTVFAGATTKFSVYLAQFGGFVFPLVTPLFVPANQTLNVTPSVSGSCAVYAAGFVLGQ